MNNLKHMLWSTFIFSILISYCTENEPNRDLKTEVRTEPRFLCTVTPLQIYILSRPKAVCASRRYYECQTTGSGSPTSLVLPIPLQHQSEVDWTTTWRRKGIVARDCLPLEPRFLADEALQPQKQAAVVPRGGGQREAGLRRETIAGNNAFLLHVVVHLHQGVKAKVPSPPIPSRPWLR